MRVIFCLLILCVSACAPQYVANSVDSEAEAPRRSAYFAERPDALSEALRMACTGPGDEFVILNKQVEQCRTLPTPDAAAFLLLTFDGALEAPLLIIEIKSSPDGPGQLVEMSYFAQVKQKSGTSRRVYFKERSVDRLLDALLQSAGGITT